MGFGRAFHVDNWHHGVASIARRNGIKTRRWGMRVTVYTGANSGDYVLSYGLSSEDIQDNDNWLKVADIGETWGGGGGGVNIYNSDGTLEGDRLVDGDGYTLSFSNLSNFEVNSQAVFVGGSDDSDPKLQLDMSADNFILSAGDVDSGTTDFSYIRSQGGSNLQLLSSSGDELIQTKIELGGVSGWVRLNAIDDNTGEGATFSVESWPTGSISMTATGGMTTIVDQWFLSLNGPLWVNSNAGTAGYVLTSNGNAAAPSWEPSGGGGANIYNTDGTLTGDRSLDGDGFNLTFDNVEILTLNSNQSSVLSSTSTTSLIAFDLISLDSINGSINVAAFDYQRFYAGTGSDGGPSFTLDKNGSISFPDTAQIQAGDGINIYIAHRVVGSGSPGIVSQADDLTTGSQGVLTISPYAGISLSSSDGGSGTAYFSVNIDGSVNFDMTGPIFLNGSAGTSGQFLKSNGAGSPPTWANASGGGSPAGADTEIQINDSGSFGAGKVFIPTDGELLLGDTGLSGSFRQIAVQGSDPHVQLFLTSKGQGEAALSSPGGITSLYADQSFQLSAPAGVIQRQSPGNIPITFGTGTSTNGFRGSHGDVTNRHGATLYYAGGDADVSGGNGNGGDVRLEAGYKNPAGSGRDGNIEFITADTGNISLFEINPNFQTGERIVFIGNAVTVPTGDAVNGGYLYVEAGALKWRGSGGTVTTIAPA